MEDNQEEGKVLNDNFLGVENFPQSITMKKKKTHGKTEGKKTLMRPVLKSLNPVR